MKEDTRSNEKLSLQSFLSLFDRGDVELYNPEESGPFQADKVYVFCDFNAIPEDILQARENAISNISGNHDEALESIPSWICLVSDITEEEWVDLSVRYWMTIFKLSDEEIEQYCFKKKTGNE